MTSGIFNTPLSQSIASESWKKVLSKQRASAQWASEWRYHDQLILDQVETVHLVLHYCEGFKKTTSFTLVIAKLLVYIYNIQRDPWHKISLWPPSHGSCRTSWLADGGIINNFLWIMLNPYILSFTFCSCKVFVKTCRSKAVSLIV